MRIDKRIRVRNRKGRMQKWLNKLGENDVKVKYFFFFKFHICTYLSLQSTLQVEVLLVTSYFSSKINGTVDVHKIL